MLDHLLGRPSNSWRRTQVFLVVLFWLWRILYGNPNAPRLLWLRRLNRRLQRFTPWQIIVSTLCGVYATRNMDKILGLGAPEPLAHLYSPPFYRAMWIASGLDAGFATAMSIRPKFLRDIASILFSVYYIVYANEADEKLRRFRAVPTVEMLRTTWEKSTHPLLQMMAHARLPRMSIRRKFILPRPNGSQYSRHITAWLFFALPEHQLPKCTELILDFPGGGFVAMSPEHHEERLRTWAWRTGKPVLSLDYGKAPEYPYPFAIDEAFETYRVLIESKGALIGMSSKKLSVVVTGDSAGATLAVNVVNMILEHNSRLPRSTSSQQQLPLPVAVVLNYAALDFNFTSWMSPENLQVLRSEQSSGHLPGLRELARQKDHLQHISPLSMVTTDRNNLRRDKSGHLRRKRSWRDALRGLTSPEPQGDRPTPRLRHSTNSVPSAKALPTAGERRPRSVTLDPESSSALEDGGALGDEESEAEGDRYEHLREEEKPLQARVKYTYSPASGQYVRPTLSSWNIQQEELSQAIADANTAAASTVRGGEESDKPKGQREPIGTRLTMTSRTGFFQDRIITPSMMRAMAILYIGPHLNPDFQTDYRISPILTPPHLLAQYPPLLMQCGEKDPFVDDTVIFAGRVRDAKRKRKIELDLVISGKSARFGESLRISEVSPGGTDTVALRAERDRLMAVSEEDWVQMIIFSDWSHGYLQMPSLMREAQTVIDELAQWIDDAFERHGPEVKNERVEHHRRTSPGRAITANGNSHRKHRPAIVDPSPFTSETETDDAGITFVPKRITARSRPSSFNTDRTYLAFDPNTASLGSSSPRAVNNRLLESGDAVNGSSDTLRNDAQSPGNYAAPDANGTPADWGSKKLSPGSPAPATGLPYDAAVQQALEEKARKASSGRGPTGQTITESELMRRRRLLDAHIFD